MDVSASSFPRYDINYGVTDTEHNAWKHAHGLSTPNTQTHAPANQAEPVHRGAPQAGEEGRGEGIHTGYAPVRHAPLSDAARAALVARKRTAGLPDAAGVCGRPYRVSTVCIQTDGGSYVALPAREVDAAGEGVPRSPLIPFSPIWLTRRPTWSR